jgi:hypothetical protein
MSSMSLSRMAYNMNSAYYVSSQERLFLFPPLIILLGS